MKKQIIIPRFQFLAITLILTFPSRAQSILDLNELDAKRVKFDQRVNIAGTSKDDKPYPLISFGTDLTTGTDAVGFRPALVAGTDIVKGHFGMSAGIRFTQVDNQKFNVEKTGQTLFINEISNYSASLGAIVGLPVKSGDPRIAFNGGFSLRGNSLFNLDSTTFKSVKNDIFTIVGNVGVSGVLMPEHISVYCDFRYLGITNNRDAYHNYFPEGSVKDYWYFQPGFRFKSIEGKDEFKNLIIDVSAIFLTKKMRVIAGNHNTIIPVVKIGYAKKIEWKNK